MRPQITPEGQAAAGRIAEARQNVNNGATPAQARVTVREITAGPTAPVTPVQPTVSANALTTPVTPVTVPQPSVMTLPKNAPGMVQNVLGSIRSQSANAQKLAEDNRLIGGFIDDNSGAQIQQNALNQYGVTPEKIKRLEEIQLQLSDRKADSALTKVRIEGGAGQTLGQAQREITQEDREANVRDFRLASEAAVLQDNIELGRELARDAVTVALADRTMKYTDLIRQNTELSKQVDEETRQLLLAENRTYEEKLADDNAAKKAIEDAIVSGAATPAEAEQLTALLPTHPDPAIQEQLQQEAMNNKRVLAQSVVSRGATQMRNLEIQSKQASIANAYDAIADRKARLALAQQEALATQLAEDATEAEVKVAKGDKALGILASVNELMNHPGFGAAVGPNPLARVEYGLAGGIFQGLFTGNKSEFKSEVDQLANTLTLENMALLKGPATDKDVEIVQNSMSRLKNMDVSEASYAEELQRLYDASNRIVQAVGITPEQAQFYGIANTDQVNEAEQLWNGTSQSTPIMLGTQTF